MDAVAAPPPLHDVSERVIRDLPIFDAETYIRMPRRRVHCPRYGPKLERLAWLHRYARVTTRLAESIVRLCQQLPIKHVAAFYGLGWDTVKELDKAPQYPSAGFASVEDARAWVARFVDWYNNEHLHSGIGYVPPTARHAGDDVALLAARRAVYQRARRRRPERWAGAERQWKRPLTVTLNPENRRSADSIAA